MLAAVDWHVVWVRIAHPDHAFFIALTRTVYVAVVAQVIGVILGLLAALMRMSKLRVLRVLSGIYVWIFRGTPLLVQIFFVYLASNQLLGFTLIPNSLDVGLFSLDGAIFAGILALGVNEGAKTCEPASTRSTRDRWRPRPRWACGMGSRCAASCCRRRLG
jgi:polar amino acid transport system permease protein